MSGFDHNLAGIQDGEIPVWSAAQTALIPGNPALLGGGGASWQASATAPTTRADGSPLVDGLDFWTNPDAGRIYWYAKSTWNLLHEIALPAVLEGGLTVNWTLTPTIDGALETTSLTMAGGLTEAWTMTTTIDATAEVV